MDFWFSAMCFSRISTNSARQLPHWACRMTRPAKRIFSSPKWQKLPAIIASHSTRPPSIITTIQQAANSGVCLFAGACAISLFSAMTIRTRTREIVFDNVLHSHKTHRRNFRSSIVFQILSLAFIWSVLCVRAPSCGCGGGKWMPSSQHSIRRLMATQAEFGHFMRTRSFVYTYIYI